VRQPSRQHPRRRGTFRRPLRVIRVLSEGKVTEPGYLNLWARLNRHNVRLDVNDRGMTPDALVRRAKQHMKRNLRSRPSEREFDEIWCVFDVDQHANLAQAIDDARQSEINIAISNPCFELWLVLHREEQTAHVDRHDIQQRSDELQLTANKHVLPAAEPILVDGVENAKQRARALDRWHAGNGSPRRENPSTDVWRLVDRLRAGLRGSTPRQPGPRG